MKVSSIYKETIDVDLRKYYSAKLDEKLNRLCEEKKITEDMIEQWGREHMRTPYKTN